LIDYRCIFLQHGRLETESSGSGETRGKTTRVRIYFAVTLMLLHTDA